MGNSKSIFLPCYDQDLLSSRHPTLNFTIKEPIRANRKTCSVRASDSIFVAPAQLSSDRSSVTEFVVNKSESTTEAPFKTPERTKNFLFSPISSPGRSLKYETSDVFARNSRKLGVNLVPKVRSKSLTGSPNSSVGPEYLKATSLIQKSEENSKIQTTLNINKNTATEKLKTVNTKKRNIYFEPLKIERKIRKKYS